MGIFRKKAPFIEVESIFANLEAAIKKARIDLINKEMALKRRARSMASIGGIKEGDAYWDKTRKIEILGEFQDTLLASNAQIEEIIKTIKAARKYN